MPGSRALIRWCALGALCVGIVALGRPVIEHQLVLLGRHVCPDGWWRPSPGICAFPPVSISIQAASLAVLAVLLLAATVLLAPSHKLKCCGLILAALALGPAYTLVFAHFSWVALASLCTVIAIAACFTLGVFSAQSFIRRQA